ncbi:MAG: HEAT repeat domain-containing protein [Myxococcota bacterium]
MMVTTFLLASLALATPASVRPSLESLAATPDAQWTAARTEAVSSVEAGALGALANDPDWRVGLTAQALQVWQSTPDEARDTWASAPAKRRDGALVFRGEGVPAVIGERLQHGAEAEATRRALVDWLRRSTVTWPSWADSAYADEASVSVRSAWIDAARYLRSADRLGGADGRQVVKLGFGDDSPMVRAQSARVAAYLDAPELIASLRQATTDASDEVAGLAARSLGMLRAAGVYEDVAAVLTRDDPRVRLWTVRSLQRLDGARAQGDARIRALTSDPDPRVARAAAEVTGAP